MGSAHTSEQTIQLPILLSPSLPTASTSHSHLSYPATDEPINAAPAPASPQPRQLLKDRLYVGNLHPTVDEYTLLQVFSRFGKVTKLDFLFHKTGPAKGKPRGYAFIEYGSQDDALKALATANDKLLRGRKLVVTFAHQAPPDQYGLGSTGLGSKRRGLMEMGKPTTLSILKSGMSGKHDGTKDKIAMMEAKLRQMEAQSPVPVSSSGPRMSARRSLPTKPTSAVSSPTLSSSSSIFYGKGKASQKKSTPTLPSLPILPQSNPALSSQASTSGSQSYSSCPAISKSTSSGLAGVRIGKQKERREGT